MKIRSRSSRTDWWEMLLWGGVLILFVIFLYNILKGWKSSGGTLTGLIQAIPQALSDTVSGIETTIANAVNGTLGSGLSLLALPFTLLFSLFNYIPAFLDLVAGFITAPFTGGTSLLSGVAEVSSLFATPAPTDTGLGSSYTGTLNGTLDGGANGNDFSVTK